MIEFPDSAQEMNAEGQQQDTRKTSTRNVLVVPWPVFSWKLDKPIFVRLLVAQEGRHRR
jgi:hypothetical protein